MKQYLVPALMGLLIGFMVVVMVTACPPENPAWHIPFWDLPWDVVAPGRLLQLQDKALVLRFCHVLIDQGLCYIALAIGITCGLARLQHMGQRSVFLWRVSVTLQTAIYLSVGAALVCGFAYAGHRYGKAPLADLSIHGLLYGCGFAGRSWLFGLAPALAVAIFLVLQFKQLKPASAGDVR